MATYIRSVDGKVQVEIEPESPATMLPNISDQGLRAQIDALRTEIRTYRGQPVVVTDSADMEDELTIYLYMGSEEGFNANHWYYYDGTEWVDGGEYVANPVLIDDTLTQSGEAADAKVTGDEISAIKADLSELDQNVNGSLSDDVDISDLYVTGYRIKTNVAIGDTVDLTPGSSTVFGYIITECNPGDVFKVKGIGGDAPRAWAFIDTTDKLLAVADAYAICDYIYVTAPTDSAKAIFNLSNGSAYIVAKHMLINVADLKENVEAIQVEISDLPDIRVDIEGIKNDIADLPEIKSDVDNLNESLTRNIDSEIDLSGSYVDGERIVTNVAVGTTVDLTPESSNTFGYILSDCVAGDVFTVKGHGGDAPRAWAFVDASNKLLAVADAYTICDYLDVTAPVGSTKAIFNLNHSSAHKVTKHTSYIEIINVVQIDESFNESAQMFDKNTIIGGKKYDNGEIVDDADYYLSDFIPIKPSTAYTYRGLNGAINYFDSEKTYLSVESLNTYDQATTKTSPSGAYYCRLQMKKGYYPYETLAMNEGSSGTKEIIYGKLLEDQKIKKPSYRFSEIPIPTEYSAVGVKAVDGSTGTDFDNENPSLTAVYDAFDALVTAFPNYITKEDLGLDQSETYHIYAYHFVPESMEAASTYYRFPYPKIMLLAGIHGSNECCENVFALYYLFKSLCYNWDESDALEYLRWNVRFSIIPVQNPYGFVNKTRQNSRSVDLNRNFAVGWKSREPGATEYGGTAPMSEAETIAIANFGKANDDALFTVDLHGTGNSAVSQTSMCYCGTQPTDEIFYVCKSLITKISHYWDSQSISGLEPMNFHSFISGSIEGDGMQRSYMYYMNGIHAMVLESFKNFQGSSYSSNSEEIMQMVGDALGYCVLLGLNHFRHQ